MLIKINVFLKFLRFKRLISIITAYAKEKAKKGDIRIVMF